MPLTNKHGKSWNCKRCDFEMVEIQNNTINEIIKILNPNFLSLPTKWKSKKGDWIKICPSCDSYPLGFETEYVFPIRTKSGGKTTIKNLDFVKAHNHTEYQKEILKSKKAGCFYCIAIFSPDEIDQWHGEDYKELEPLALCPECGIDAVIGDASGYPIETTFLSVMHDFWFSPNEWSKTMGASAVN